MLAFAAAIATGSGFTGGGKSGEGGLEPVSLVMADFFVDSVDFLVRLWRQGDACAPVGGISGSCSIM